MDFTDAGDDAERVLAVCDDVILSHEPEGDLAVFDREAGTFAAVGDEQDAESVVGEVAEVKLPEGSWGRPGRHRAGQGERRDWQPGVCGQPPPAGELAGATGS